MEGVSTAGSAPQHVFPVTRHGSYPDYRISINETGLSHVERLDLSDGVEQDFTSLGVSTARPFEKPRLLHRMGRLSCPTTRILRMKGSFISTALLSALLWFLFSLTFCFGLCFQRMSPSLPI